MTSVELFGVWRDHVSQLCFYIIILLYSTLVHCGCLVLYKKSWYNSWLLFCLTSAHLFPLNLHQVKILTLNMQNQKEGQRSQQRKLPCWFSVPSWQLLSLWFIVSVSVVSLQQNDLIYCRFNDDESFSWLSCFSPADVFYSFLAELSTNMNFWFPLISFWTH